MHNNMEPPCQWDADTAFINIPWAVHILSVALSIVRPQILSYKNQGYSMREPGVSKKDAGLFWLVRAGYAKGEDHAEILETGSHCVKFVRIADGVEQVARFLCILQGGKVEGLFRPACQNFEHGIGGLDERM